MVVIDSIFTDIGHLYPPGFLISDRTLLTIMLRVPITLENETTTPVGRVELRLTRPTNPGCCFIVNPIGVEKPRFRNYGPSALESRRV